MTLLIISAALLLLEGNVARADNAAHLSHLTSRSEWKKMKTGSRLNNAGAGALTMASQVWNLINKHGANSSASVYRNPDCLPSYDLMEGGRKNGDTGSVALSISNLN